MTYPFLFFKKSNKKVEAAGETTEGMAESTSKLRDKILALSGVDIMIDGNNFKSTYQILDELSDKWSKLEETERASLTELIAGKNRANVFESLMGNFETAREALSVSLGAEGSAAAELAKYTDSIQGHINVLKTSFEELSANFISSDLVKFFVDAATGALNVVNGIVEVTNSLGGLKTVLVAVIGTVSAINISTITKSLSNFGDTLFSICSGTHIKSFVSKMKELPDAMRIAKSEGKGLSAALDLIGVSASTAQIAIMALTIAITAAIAAYSNWRQNVEKQRQEAIDAAKASASEAENIMKLYSAYKEADAAYESNTGSKEALNTATSELLSALGVEEGKISELVGAYGDLDTAINNVTSDALQKAASDAISGYNAAYDELQDSVGNGTNIWENVKKYFGFGNGNEVLSWNQELESVNQKIKSVLTSLGMVNETSIGTTGGVMIIDTDSVDGLIASYDKLILARDALQKELTTDEYNDSHAVDMIEGKIASLQPIIQGYLDARQLLNESQAKLVLFDEFTNIGVPETAEDVVELRNRLVEAAIASGDFAGSADDIGAAFDSAIGEFSYMGPAIAEAKQLLNDAAEAADKFHERLTMEQPEIAGGNRLQYYAKQLQELGLTDVDLQSFVLDPNSTEDGAAAFRALAAAADEYGISVNALIPLLVKWGYVSSNASSQAESSLSSLQDTAKSAADATQNVLSMITGAQEMITSQSTGKSISVENFNTAELNGYADALEYVNGSLQLNAERVNELVKAKAAEQIATNDANKAAAQTKYLENAKQLRELRKELTECGDNKKDLRAQIEKNIETLTSENSSLKNTISEYDLMSASLNEATSAYQHWLNAQSASQTGDMFDSTITAMDLVKKALNDSTSEYYRRFNNENYKAAIDLVIPSSVDSEDQAAINAYLRELNKIITTDGAGNKTVNFANFIRKAVDAGLMVLNDAGTDYEVVAGKTMDDFSKYLLGNGLEITDSMMQAIFGEMQEFGDFFSWDDEVSKSVGDLAISASDALDNLKQSLTDNYEEILSSAGDVSQTVFGNIDTNARQVLQWTDENLEKYKDAIGSWGATVDDMRGSYSTVFGSSGEYDGVEIAFSPMLQTDSGAVLLSADTVDKYIWGLIDKAGEGWTGDDLLRLDVEGLEIDGQRIQGLLADIGDTAAETAEKMHFTGTDGAVNNALEMLKSFDTDIVIDVSGFKSATEKAEILENTIRNVSDLKLGFDVDSSEIEYANQIIEYCLAQKQLLCAPDVMMVDTSVVQGKLGDAIATLQEFHEAQNALEHAQTLGLDTTQAQANLDAATAKVQALDSNITSEKALNIDTTSINTIADSLQSLTADLIVKAGVDESAVIGYQQSEHDSTGTVTMEVDSSAVDKYIAQTKVSSGTVVWNNDTRLVKTVFYANGVINWSGAGSASGTAHASGTAKAGGDWGTAPGGKTLVGELGPEIVVNVHSGKWYTVGDNGAEFRDIPPGSIVFNHEQSKALLEHGYVSSRGHSMASGTAMVSGSIPVNGRYPGSGSGSSGGGSGSSNSSSSSTDDAKTWFEEAYAYHQHLLAMDQESMEDYLRWLEDAYRQAYAEGIIELEDMYKYEEECYEKSKEIFNDYLNDIEFKIEGLARQDGTASQIVNIYLSAIQDINNKIAEARARGLNDNDDYIQELIKKRYEYEDAIEDIRDDATDNAKNAVDDLIQYRIKMLKQDLQNEKDALEDKKSALKDFYNEQKQMLQDAYDEEKTQEEREEKRKAKSDIEAELAQLEFDDSAWAQKRKLELQEELADAQKDLDDFEKEQTLNNTQDMLDDMYEKQAEQIQTEIDAIEEALNNPEALYNQALRDIQNNTEALFEEMVQYNAKYGDGDPSTVKEMWDEAKKSLDDFLETFGRAYKDIILVASPSGYASGTSNATRGIHEVDEKGAEWLFTSGDGTKYRVFSGGEKVLDANATNFLYNFATTGGKILSDAFSSLLNAIMPSKISNQQQPLQISTGDIIIQGNANEKTVSEIRRAQRDNVEHILKAFTKLNK